MAKRRWGQRRSAGSRAAPAALIAAALAGVVVALLFLAGDEEPAPARGAVDDQIGAAAAGIETPIRGAENVFGFLGAALRSRERIDALEREVAELEQWRALALALAERNERYEALLNMPTDGLGAALAPGAGVSARLLLDAGGPFRRTLLANAGAIHGVKRGYIAVNEHGLVGRVVGLGQRTSRVLMLDDYNSRIPVMGQASRVRAVAVGAARSTLQLEGPIAAEPPVMQFVVGADRLREGELIVTSGDGGLFPAGLMVGVAAQDGFGRWRVRLATAQAPIDYVRLIPYAPIEAPEAAPAEGGPLPVAPVAPRALLDAAPATPVAPAPPPVAFTAPPPEAVEDDEAPPAPSEPEPLE